MLRRIGGSSLLALTGGLALTGVAAAAGTVVFNGSPGTKAPPRRLDRVPMAKFARDSQPRNVLVTSVKGPTGMVAFAPAGAHLVVKNVKHKRGYWKQWSHRYRGDVYYFAKSAKLTLPSGTTAFYFYAEPNGPGVFKMTARAGGASSGPVKVNSAGGARFFGFVAKGGARLTTITVTANDRRTKKYLGGFAIGEFGIHGS